MSKFDELLRQPLPSKRSGESLTESELDLNNSENTVSEEDTIDAQVSSEIDNVADDTTVDNEDIADAIDAGEDFDPDDMSDDELEQIDRELTGETMDEIIGKDENEEVLSPEEELEADDMMQTAATALLVNDALNTEEKVALINDEDEVNTIINEGFMRECDFDAMRSNTEDDLVEEASGAARFSRPTMIRFSAADKKKQLYALAVNVSAAAHNDPDYRKYKKVLKLRKILKVKLERKYRTEANKRMRVYFKRLTRSASPTLNKIAAKG